MDISYSHTWLNGAKDYTSGLEFYMKYGSSDVIKKLLQAGPTKFNNSKLLSEIQKIADANPEIFIQGGKRKIDRAMLSQELQIEFDKLQSLIQAISWGNSRLDLIQNDLDRYNCAAEILNNVQARRMIFMRIDHFIDHGTDLVKKSAVKIPVIKTLSEDKELRKLQLREELILLRAQRSKLKMKAHRVADYNKVLTRIEQIEKALKDE